jgi:lipopolysaccharide transport system ATP-binding protein
MSAIQRLCPRSILLDGGMIKASGKTQKVVKQYLSSAITFSDAYVDMTKLMEKEFSAEGIRFTRCWIENSQGQKTPALQYGEPFTICFEIESQKTFKDLAFHVGIDTSDGMRVFTSDSEEYGRLFSISSSSTMCVSVQYKYFVLMPGKYHLSKLMVRHGNVVLALSLNNIGFEITSQSYNCKTPPFVKSGIIAGQSEWRSW